MYNFDSVYNTPAPYVPPPFTTRIPLDCSAAFPCSLNRPSSPLFRRGKSPPPRQHVLPESGPKFNFNLYKTDENDNLYDDCVSPSYRPLSPSSSLSSSRIYHHPTRSSLTSPNLKSSLVLKLRHVNDELCHTLAQSEAFDPSQQLGPHYHIHHYPLSQHPYQNYYPPLTSEDYPPSTEVESPKVRKTRVTYKLHIPKQQQQQQQRVSSRPKSPSDVSSSDDTITVDLYPTRDQDFVKQVRKHSDKQSPWLVDGIPLRRDSYSDTNISRPPKGPYYGDKPIKSHRRSVRGKECPSSSSRQQSPHLWSRNRSNSAQLNTSDSYRRSTKQPKSSSKSKSSSREPIWHPPSRTVSARPPKYFEPTLKHEYDTATGKRLIIVGTESEPISQRNIVSDRVRIRHDDPKFKKRIANAESKVKSAWEPTVTGLSQPTAKESKPPNPLFVKETTPITTPPKSKVKSVPSEPTTPIKNVVPTPPQLPRTTNTGRNSLHDIPTKPIFASTPRNQSIVEQNDDDDAADLFENESPRSQHSKTTKLPHPPPQIETIPTPIPEQHQEPATELPKPTVPKLDESTKAPIRNDVVANVNKDQNTHNDNQQSSSATDANSNKTNDNDDDDEETSEEENEQPVHKPSNVSKSARKVSFPKSDNKSEQSGTDDDDADENDQEVARSFNMDQWLTNVSKPILDATKARETTHPSPPPSTTLNVKTTPHRKEQPPIPPPESPDHNLYKPPFGPKKKEEKSTTPLPPPPTATTTAATDDVDDFFS